MQLTWMELFKRNEEETGVSVLSEGGCEESGAHHILFFARSSTSSKEGSTVLIDYRPRYSAEGAYEGWAHSRSRVREI